MTIFILGPDTKMLYKLRGDLIEQLVEYGHQVTAVAPDREFEKELRAFRADFIQLPFQRTALNPFHDVKLLLAYRRLFKAEKPDLVFSYSLKPVLYASLAAGSVKIPRVYALIPGSGIIFGKRGSFSAIVRFMVSIFYKRSFKACNKVFFQNREDMSLFTDNKLLPAEKCIRVNGTGVNMQRFMPCALPRRPVFLMISRLLINKGVLEYCEAAQKIKALYPKAKFMLVGSFDENPMSLKSDALESYLVNGVIEYFGEVRNVMPLVRRSSVFVLPTYYNEGIPRTILEAMAMARPVITTDWRGCRDAVQDQVNGFLVPIRNVDALCEKMEHYIQHPDQIEKMGYAGYKICKEKYDVRTVNDFMIAHMGLHIPDHL